MAEASDRGELLTALTTEHFTLQGVVALLRFADRLLDARTGGVEPVFPSRPAGAA